jgi:hypothetical protein
LVKRQGGDNLGKCQVAVQVKVDAGNLKPVVQPQEKRVFQPTGIQIDLARRLIHGDAARDLGKGPHRRQIAASGRDPIFQPRFGCAQTWGVGQQVAPKAKRRGRRPDQAEECRSQIQRRPGFVDQRGGQVGGKDHQKIAAWTRVQKVLGQVRHGQMVRGDDQHGILEGRVKPDMADELGCQTVGTVDGVQELVRAIAIGLIGATLRRKAKGMMGVQRQHHQTEGRVPLGQRIKPLDRLRIKAVVEQTPFVDIGRVSQPGFKLGPAFDQIEMVAVVEGALARKAQIRAADIGKIIALGVQKVANAGRTGQEPVEPRTRPDQRHAALAGHHSRNGPARLFHLGQVGKADRLALQRPKVWHQPRKAGFVQIAAFHRLKVKQHEIPGCSGECRAFDRHKARRHRPQFRR